MKICPKCQQTYTDETLNFCLDDGTTLTQAGAGDLPQTVMIQPPRPTDSGQSSFGNQTGQNQGFGSQPPSFGSPTQPQGSWNAPATPQFSPQNNSAPKSSKTWMWVVGIIGGLILLCGGGFGILALIGMGNDEPKPAVNNSTPSPTPKNVNKYDMSPWKVGTNEFATTKYSGGVFTMEVIADDYSYVVLARDFQTQDKITKLTVKNIEAKTASNGGFGLLVHSDSTPFVADYGFVIDSENKKYRVIEHAERKEKIVTDWKSFSDIKSGTEENILEVRDSGGKMEFYINGKYATTVDDKYNNSSGWAGIFSGDGIPIGFSNLTTETK